VATVTVIRDPLSGKTFTGAGARRMYLYAETSGISLSVPYAPREISYEDLAQDWVQAERSGAKALLLRKAPKLATVKFTLLLADTDRLHAQTSLIANLRRLASSQERLLVRYGPNEAGLWRMTDCTIASSQRHPDTNEVTQATASIVLTEASDAAPAVGPVAPPPPPPPPPAPPAPRTYTVVKGDCLWKIAQRFYGQGILWPRIFDANRGKIKNPSLIYPAQVFVIP
jgi:LysM repeat protein